MIHLRTLLISVVCFIPFTPMSSALAKEGVIRAGIIGCDTSHVIAFTNALNDPQASGPLANVKVTAAFPGGTDVPASKDRLAGYVKQLREKGIKIVDTIDQLTEETDAILLESVDGRPHLQQFRAAAKGQPIFVDKPAAVSLADIISIFRIAEETHTPVFSSSSLRFCKEVQDAAHDQSIGDMLGCETVGPLSLMTHHPDLFFYGIHGVEPLFAIMGTGCETMSRTDSPLSTVVVGKWKDGRIGSYRGLKRGHSYAVSTYGTKGILQHKIGSDYTPLLIEICNFFKSRQPPVSREQTVEIYAFMEAADESKRQGGKPVAISDIVHSAEQQSLARSASTSGGE